MDYENGLTQLRDYMFSSKPKLVKAAFELKRFAERYDGDFGRIENQFHSGTSKSLHRDIGRMSHELYKRLEEGVTVCEKDISKLEKTLQDLAKSVKDDEKTYAYARRERERYYDELAEQRYRENHTNYWTGEWCPKGPD